MHRGSIESVSMYTHTVKTKINEKSAMSLDLPPLVRSGVPLLLCPSGQLNRSFLAVFFAPFPKYGILNYIAHFSLILVFTVWYPENSPQHSNHYRSLGSPQISVIGQGRVRKPPRGRTRVRSPAGLE